MRSTSSTKQQPNNVNGYGQSFPKKFLLQRHQPARPHAFTSVGLILTSHSAPGCGSSLWSSKRVRDNPWQGSQPLEISLICCPMRSNSPRWPNSPLRCSPVNPHVIWSLKTGPGTLAEALQFWEQWKDYLGGLYSKLLPRHLPLNIYVVIHYDLRHCFCRIAAQPLLCFSRLVMKDWSHFSKQSNRFASIS